MADKLIDLKRTATDQPQKEDCMPCASNQEYPYGLNVCLEAQELEKLGITQMPAVGAEIKGQFVGVVTACRQELNEDQEPSLSMQIVMMTASIEAEPMQEMPAKEASESKGMYRGPKRPAAIVD